jgi:hypothetical protein
MSENSTKSAGFSVTALHADIAKINDQMRRLRVDAQHDTILLTYVGRFEMLQDLPNRVEDFNGHTRGLGLGHSNWAPAQMVIKGVEDLSVEHARKFDGAK